MSDIRRSDLVCTALGQVFDTRHNHMRHLEIYALFKTYEEKLAAISYDLQTGSEEGLQLLTQSLRPRLLLIPIRSSLEGRLLLSV